MKENTLNSKINLKDLLRLLKNNLIFIIVIMVAFTGIGYVLSHYVMQEHFTATTSLIVATKKPKSAETERSIYQEMLRDNQFLKKVRKNLDLSISMDQLVDSVSLSVDEKDVDKSTSHAYWLTVSGSDKKECKKTVLYLSKKLKPELLKLKEVESVKTYSHNQVATMQTAPHYKVITTTWGIVGLLIPIFIILFSWLHDGTFKRSTEIEQALDLPVYGVIPDEKSAKKVDGKRKDKQS
jgi:capsular polysaccharide biosynthesis protein